MGEIKIEKNPSQERLDELGVTGWGIWTKEVSEFPWTYHSTETCYVLEGDVVVTTENGEEVTIEKGDLVTFPKGMNCVWNVRKPIRKHYTFED